MANTDAQQKLAEEILEDARRRAERAISRARTEADKIVSAAQAEAETLERRLAAEAAARAEKRAQAILSSVAQESARRRLYAREEVVQSAFRKAREALNALAPEAYYRAALTLAAEAARAMESDALRVSVGGGGRAFDAEAFRNDLQTALQGGGRRPTVEIVFDAHAAPGVIVESADGRLRWDNTFEARLRRLGPALRDSVAAALFDETQRP